MQALYARGLKHPTAFRPQVVLIMPAGGAANMEATRCYYWARPTACDLVGHSHCASSAAQHSFNGLLAHALDLRDGGDVVVEPEGPDRPALVRKAPTHLAMIHSDVEPLPADWLDVLWAEMQRLDLDLIASNVPIKEPERVRTSTAIGDRDDIWTPRRYVNNADRATLPETFTPEDVCGPGEVLLLNNGLMLADLRKPWWDDFAFTVETRIVRRDGRRVAQFVSEDWLCARHVQAHGGRVAATWAVPIKHHGESEWWSHG